MENNREIISPFIIHKPEEVIKPIWFMDYNKPHVGEIHKTNQGYDVMIIDYNTNKHVTVQFMSNDIKRDVQMGVIYDGEIRNPYHPNQYGGYLGEGIYNTRNKKIHQTWNNMLQRHNINIGYYNPLNASYINSSICNEWYNYQNFALWYDNYISSLNPDFYKLYELDKDILQWNNEYKIYSPNTCCIVPKEINISLIGIQCIRSAHMPGVRKKGNKYEVRIGYKGYYIGSYNTPEEAFEAYIKAKKERLCFLADKYYSINAIKKEVYDALYNLEISPYAPTE